VLLLEEPAVAAVEEAGATVGLLFIFLYGFLSPAIVMGEMSIIDG
jgi:hypothetical protein